jgi:Domain of unknown function (DUF5915)
VSECGSLMIAVDTTCDEEILQELRARTFVATVQKLRKTAGLVVSDRVEIFYEESDGLSPTSVSAAMLHHSTSTVKRIKSLPLSMGLCSKQAIVLIREVVTDGDISKSPVTIVLTQPCVAVDTGAIESTDAIRTMAAMYLQSMDYDRLSEIQEVRVTVDNTPLVLLRGKHFFLSANEMVASSSFTARSTYPNLPTEL